ncbi:MAG TPA: enoyl-CoA hydratase-related protein [Nocardioides sp.]|uniref:enoyl-CoA hydratase/isomerase family protein n=1 Tax=uncultured Nocardioides sp. TaxID=198441 RepID=UPI002625A613|nr:enoyl-CoA hydratase-related protein [uncultured Nocardioides sp.]HRI94132.1 enoyl-CoA hydratase-related protein [Nocardioides sp.]HRK44085.1 enoyl-CoA hydratase-related protein [Nocardioides sp.]
MISDNLVITTVTAGVAHLELNRPEAYNAADEAACRALQRALIDAGGNDEVQVILLSGRGKAFCAGGDVKAMAAADDPAAMISALADASHAVVRELESSTKPIVAVVHGSAAGAGLGYVCAADIVVAGESAKFLTAFMAIGVSPDSGNSWYLPRIVGQRRAMEMLLLNKVLTAPEALAWGLVNSVHPDGEVLEAGVALATRLAAGPTAALGRTRRLVADAADRTLGEQLDAEAGSITEMITTFPAPDLIQRFAGR